MLPHEIRELRQKLTQKDFAERLGVSRLTAHRWELPLDHPQARRPQGKTLRRLLQYREKIAAPPPAPAPVGPQSLSPPRLMLNLSSLGEDEALAFHLVLEALEWGNFAHCQILLNNLTENLTPPVRLLLGSCRVYLGLFQQHNPTTLRPLVDTLLHETGDGHPLAQQLAQQAAAFYFAWPHQACFHPDRAFAHAAAAIRAAGSPTAPLAMHGHAARLQAALLQGERRLYDFFTLQAQGAIWGAATPLSRGFALQAAAHHANHQGWTDEARELFQKLVAHGEAFELPWFQRRGYAGLANSHYFGGGAVPDTLHALHQGLLTTGPPDTATLDMKGLQARITFQNLAFDQVAPQLQECRTLEHLLGWRDSHALFTRILTCIVQESTDQLQQLYEDTQNHFTPAFPNKDVFTMLNLLRGWHTLSRGRMGESFHHWRLALETSRRHNVMAPLARNAWFATFFLSLASGKPDDALACWREMQTQENWAQGVPFFYLMQAYWGLFLAIRGRFIEGELEALSSRHFFQRTRDHFYHLLTRRITALIQDLAQSPGHEQAIAQTGRDMHRHGVNPSLYSPENVRYMARQMGLEPAPPPAPVSRHDMKLAWMIKHLNLPGHSFFTLCQTLVSLVEEATRGRRATLLLWNEEPAWQALVGAPLDTPHEVFEFYAGDHGRLTLQVEEPLSSAETALIIPLLDTAAQRLAGFGPNWAGRFLRGEAAHNPAAQPFNRQEVPALREILLGLAADLESPVLVQPSPGHNPEFLARRLHALSQNKNGPFVVAPLSKIPRAQQRRTLFGDGETPGGLLREAHGGTLFVPDLTQLAIRAQKELFTHLQKARAWFTGETPEAPAFRLMAASSRPLQPLVQSGVFHAPLYWSLQAVVVNT